ncbi:RGMB (predicted) [Pycnogonum litorale]
MGRRKRSGHRVKLKSSPPPLVFFVYGSFVILLMCIIIGVDSRCRVEECTRKYSHRVREPGPNLQYCTYLRTYAACIRSKARSCRGDLSYHSTSSLVIHLNSENNCSYIVSNSRHKPPVRTNVRHRNKKFDVTTVSNGFDYDGEFNARRECVYRDKPDFRHCALFGDPHLRTFHDHFQTCAVKGAWPLIDNSYLAVQVTNGPVAEGYKATAPTKITVIVKAHSPCTEEKTYESQVDNVPSAFIDGTKTSDLGQSVSIRERLPGRHIEISIRYIATVVVVRQIGSYLTFAIRMPKEVALRGAHHRLGLELCVKGCPVKERIDYNSFLAKPDTWIKSVAKDGGATTRPATSKSRAVSICQKRNVTDHFFDACVFDLLTTGDASFVDTAETAQRDILALHPGAIAKFQNRTYLVSDAGFHNSGRNTDNSAPSRTTRAAFVIVVFSVLWRLLR